MADCRNPVLFELSIHMKAQSKEAMKKRLLEILDSFDSSYGKPCQGTCDEYKLTTKIVTPIWDGQEY